MRLLILTMLLFVVGVCFSPTLQAIAGLALVILWTRLALRWIDGKR